MCHVHEFMRMSLVLSALISSNESTAAFESKKGLVGSLELFIENYTNQCPSCIESPFFLVCSFPAKTSRIGLSVESSTNHSLPEIMIHYSNLIGKFQLIKVFWHVDFLRLTQRRQDFHSLHARCERTVAHLEEHHSQTVHVHFLKSRQD